MSLARRFVQRFGGTPRVFRAPGRVNLIGEHTDYNDGFVLPAAIEFATWVAIAPRADHNLAVHSENFAETAEFDLDKLTASRSNHWPDYVVGVAREVAKAGHRSQGANLLVLGDIPQGAGLSSSAALEVAVGYALLTEFGAQPDLRMLARLCQRAENEFVGARCGIMDQFVSCYGQRDHALLLDCRSLEYRHVPMTRDVRIVICNTMVRHSVAAGEYNRRRAECEAGVHSLVKFLPEVRALRDVTPADLAAHEQHLPDLVRRRCRHVISENARVVEAAAALKHGDLKTLGDLMRQSHRSMRDDFEISCPELDVMVELAEKLPGVYGARMTGGGFGGCTANLVDAGSVPSFQQAMTKGYEKATGRKPEIYISSASQGVGEAEPATSQKRP